MDKDMHFNFMMRLIKRAWSEMCTEGEKILDVWSNYRFHPTKAVDQYACFMARGLALKIKIEILETTSSEDLATEIVDFV